MPEASSISEPVIRVGACEWQPRDRRLIVRGEEKKLVWRAMECWSPLVEAGGDVVTREQLHQRIWGDALMEESNLANTVAVLRKAVDPAPDGNSYIETIPRMGYRLAVAVQRAEPEILAIEEPPKR